MDFKKIVSKIFGFKKDIEKPEKVVTNKKEEVKYKVVYTPEKLVKATHKIMSEMAEKKKNKFS